ncbi:DNA-directed RNA polymerase subunit beta [Nocardia asteroides]|uniref:DNA-directed RNA polymerase subunit beta n=1 Tax=Nocardia asteroides TaxID=1824 RepID=UPI0037CB7C1A
MDRSQSLDGVTVEARCAYYQVVCQLPAVIDPGSGQIVVNAGRVQAVMVPARFGPRIQTMLNRREDGVGPIVSHPRSMSWTFLTRSDRRIEIAVDDTLLWANNIVVVTTGKQIGLPTPSASASTPVYREWVRPPHSPQRPTTFTVLDTVRECLTQGRTR